MSRYLFTTRAGHSVTTVTASSGLAAAAIARTRTGRTDLLCTHLSDDHTHEGTDAILFDGPDGLD